MTPAVRREAAEGFGRHADAYERGRPDFPVEAVSFMAELLSLGPGSRTVDVGAGTGKLTRLLLPFGGRTIAVEPVAGMRIELARHMPASLIVGGVAEALPIRDGWATGVMAAHAFHWFDGDRALAEMARVLIPTGALVLTWNRWDADRSWTRSLRGVIEQHRGGVPTHRTETWRAAFERTDAFTRPELRTFEYGHDTTPEGVVDRIRSISFIGALPAPEQTAVVAAVRQALATDPETAGRAHLRFPYRTEVWWSRRQDPAG